MLGNHSPFAQQYLLRWFVFPIYHTHVLAFLSHYFKPYTPGDRLWYHSRTLLLGLHQMGRSFATFGTYTLGSLKGIMRGGVLLAMRAPCTKFVLDCTQAA